MRESISMVEEAFRHVDCVSEEKICATEASAIHCAVEGCNEIGLDFTCADTERRGVAEIATPSLLHTSGLQVGKLSRKEKRKKAKKLKRKLARQQAAEKERLDECARVQDFRVQLKLQLDEQAEVERLLKEKEEHDAQEKLWLEREKKLIEEIERKREEIARKEEEGNALEDEQDWIYVDDDGPSEIIWEGNEIIVRKRKVKVPKGMLDVIQNNEIQDVNQPTSNPLPPQSAAFAAYRRPVTPDVTEQPSNFGTEQDKTHCPFHIKTGVCRFGVRCSRVHVYPDHSFTLLIRNMYTGPGLTWERDEGLEDSPAFNMDALLQMSSGQLLQIKVDSGFGAEIGSLKEPALFDEEVAQQYEEFYEDVHSEFLQFGELVNFKVCRNESAHLRGNVYVHFQSEVSAHTAYASMNGRFYAGRQITCEFVGVTRWKVAICGEYMKAHHRLCSHGTACNFLHCFLNPRGEYDWADWDAPPPRAWVRKMAKLFAYKQESDDHHGDHRQHSLAGRSRSALKDSYKRRSHRSRESYDRSSADEYENDFRQSHKPESDDDLADRRYHRSSGRSHSAGRDSSRLRRQRKQDRHGHYSPDEFDDDQFEDGLRHGYKQESHDDLDDHRHHRPSVRSHSQSKHSSRHRLQRNQDRHGHYIADEFEEDSRPNYKQESDDDCEEGRHHTHTGKSWTEGMDPPKDKSHRSRYRYKQHRSRASTHMDGKSSTDELEDNSRSRHLRRKRHEHSEGSLSPDKTEDSSRYRHKRRTKLKSDHSNAAEFVDSLHHSRQKRHRHKDNDGNFFAEETEETSTRDRPHRRHRSTGGNGSPSAVEFEDASKHSRNKSHRHRVIAGSLSGGEIEHTSRSRSSKRHGS